MQSASCQKTWTRGHQPVAGHRRNQRMLDCKFAQAGRKPRVPQPPMETCEECPNPNPYGRGPPRTAPYSWAFTSNMISSGVRESIRYLSSTTLVDVPRHTGGAPWRRTSSSACTQPTSATSIAGRAAQLRQAGINRIGNLAACRTRTTARLRVVAERSTTPSRCSMPVPPKRPSLCSALPSQTGACAYRCPGLVLDAIEGHPAVVNSQAVFARNTGMNSSGRRGREAPHLQCQPHCATGPTFAVFVNTGQEFDGSDSGARPDDGRQLGQNPAGRAGCEGLLGRHAGLPRSSWRRPSLSGWLAGQTNDLLELLTDLAF
uniref:Uncharacterized protein n=1 Tax=Macrostomum lignano TaxID=282301 RepID=A0A1I8FR38_9PLAT